MISRAPGAWQRKAGLVLAFLLLVSGCKEVVVTEADSDNRTLCYSDFELCVSPILDAQLSGRAGPATCAASGCHDQASGSGGAFKIYAQATPTSAQMLANYYAASAFANLDDPGQSKLLLEPLQGVSSITGTHTGGDIFPDTGDACYVAIHDWISNQVEASDSTACGQCTVPDTASCGY